MATRSTNKRATTARARRRPRISAEELDRLADLPHDDPEGDLSPYIDWSKARRPGLEVQRVPIDFPADLLRAIDREAAQIGVTRQALIKIRMADAVDAARRLAVLGGQFPMTTPPRRRRPRKER